MCYSNRECYGVTHRIVRGNYYKYFPSNLEQKVFDVCWLELYGIII